VSQLVPPEHAFVALMHDATEAYCQDIVRPLKQGLPGYKEIEERNWRAICDRFDLAYELPECVHHADIAMLFAEQEALMPPSPIEGDRRMGLVTPIKTKVRIFGHMPGRATVLFLKRFNELYQPAEALA
jgi:uncharacterized protein